MYAGANMGHPSREEGLWWLSDFRERGDGFASAQIRSPLRKPEYSPGPFANTMDEQTWNHAETPHGVRQDPLYAIMPVSLSPPLGDAQFLHSRCAQKPTPGFLEVRRQEER
jgi:hypothetical protein